MKIALLIAVLVPLAAHAKPATSSLDPTDLAEVDLVEDVSRIKRSGLGSGSGSFDLLSGLKKTLLSGIGSASASLVAGSSSSSLGSGSGHSSSGSSSSSGYGSSGHSYDKPHEDTHFDGWSLKKSILNTLFQAVKAITGGVTAIKGQLIKGSGYLVSGAGKLIASGGDAVTGVGKKIAQSAHLIPPKHASHPFAKLSGILSSSSSGLSGSSSSSSSGHHHGDASGESFTSYEGPTSYGHDSSHGSLSGPSGPSYIPPSKSSHKSPSLNSYGSDHDDHHHHHGGSYVSSGKYGHSSDVSQHQQHYPTAYSKGHSNVVEASDVLRQILNQNIPHQTTDHGYPKKVIAQYEIPSDSNPPPFKPIKTGYLPPALYGLPAGPIDSVTHSHSITTSFGAAGFPKLHQTVVESEPGLPSSYDIYRSMSLKHTGPRPGKSSSEWADHEVGHSASGVSYELLPPKTSSGELVHEQQLHDLAKHLGGGIEVQKSLTYEIADPSTAGSRLHQKRRSDEATQTTNDDKHDDNGDAASQPQSTNT
ncbi:uncharacterized protein LOC128728460 [Anopheles nili]|uniref:uncharacterized protein LOC128728460 n=1 Tax=Anopheles nili TaxID=185578 RepID=UPI00237A0C65|nr:uncharacterized protein LOC128728460 [Anopheles nili]